MLISTHQEESILVNDVEGLGTVLAQWNGLIGLNIQETEAMESQTDMEHLRMWMEMCMKANEKLFLYLQRILLEVEETLIDEKIWSVMVIVRFN